MCLEGLACLNEGTESASTAQQYTLRKEPDAGNLLRCRYHRFYRKKNHTMAPKKKVSALLKMADLSARDVEAGMKIIEGTARSMGITVTD